MLCFGIIIIMTQRLYSQWDKEDKASIEARTYRGKASKMAEIESYVAVLIENNKIYTDELNIMQKQNLALRGQIELLMGQNIRLKQVYEEQLDTTRTNFNSQISRLIEQLKDILHERETMESSYKTIIEELSFQHDSEAKNRQLQFNELERGYDQKIRKLSDRLNDQCKEAEKIHYTTSQNKLKMVQQIDNLHFELSEMKRLNHDLKEENEQQTQELNKVSKSLKLASGGLEEQTVNFLRMEQEKNQCIIELKKSNHKLRQQLQKCTELYRKAENSLNAKEKDYHLLLDKFENTKHEKHQIEQSRHELEVFSNERISKLEQVQNQLKKLDDFHAKEQRRTAELIRLLETDNTKLLKDNDLYKNDSSGKQAEINSLLKRLKESEDSQIHLSKSLLQVEDQNDMLKRENHSLQQDFECLQLEAMSLSERIQLQTNHTNTLELVLEKQRKKLTYFDNSQAENSKIEEINEIRLRFERERQDIIQIGEIQKDRLKDQLLLERERLLRIFQGALREKESIFKDKIETLKIQIENLK